jgi:hypothetical protein
MRSTTLAAFGLLSLAGCGDTPRHTYDDAGPVDAPVDAPRDAAATSVQITIYDGSGNLAANVPVAFVDAAGALVADAKTDATGVARAVMAAGGSVTASRPGVLSGTRLQLYTFAGVVPGDKLVLGPPPPGVMLLESATITLPVEAGALLYSVVSACPFQQVTAPGSGATPTVSYTSLPCGDAPGLVAIAQGTRPLGTITKPALAPSGTIDLTAETYTPPRTMTITGSNLGADVGVVESRFIHRLGPIVVDDFRPVTTHDNVTNTLTASMAAPADPALTVVGDLILYTGLISAHQDMLRVAAPSTTFTVDTAPNLLPWTLDRGKVDAAARTVTWGEMGTGTPTITHVHVGASSPTFAFDWNIVAPYTAGKVTLPPLPASFATFSLTAATALGVDAFELIKLPAGGWDALRPHAFDLPDLSALLTPGPEVVTISTTGGVP